MNELQFGYYSTMYNQTSLKSIQEKENVATLRFVPKLDRSAGVYSGIRPISNLRQLYNHIVLFLLSVEKGTDPVAQHFKL